MLHAAAVAAAVAAAAAVAYAAGGPVAAAEGPLKPQEKRETGERGPGAPACPRKSLGCDEGGREEGRRVLTAE